MSNCTFLITQVDLQNEHKHVAYYLISSKDLPYVQKVSFNCFFNAIKQRNRNDRYLYYMQVLEELKALASAVNGQLKDIYSNQYPLIKCQDLWDFYTKIGYNRKTKKYEVHV